MSKAKDEYYKWLNKEHWQVKEIIQPYVSELEQNFETSESTLGFNTGVIIPKLEAEKAELIEAYKELLDDAMYLYQYYPNNFRNLPEEYFKSDIELLQKHEVKV